MSKIGNFEGIDIILEEKHVNSAVVSCNFDSNILKMELFNSGAIEIIETNMCKAQVYYISNSVRDLYLSLVKCKAAEVV